MFRHRGVTRSTKAYDAWAETYDEQPGNLMLDLDEEIFSTLLRDVALADKFIMDAGCGTGRHWKKLLAGNPRRLAGYDSSPGMLAILRKKYPQAETYLVEDDRLSMFPDRSIDLVTSTLTIAHMDHLESCFSEWDRVLMPEADIIITDYHPVALKKGAKRTFQHKGETVTIVNFVHPIDEILKITGKLGWTEWRYIENKIDDSHRHYYKQKNALPVFEKYQGVPIIFGLHLKKSDGTL
jgi:ubiquinone/menaquinone biosynthesis C-methylase UbiE